MAPATSAPPPLPPSVEEAYRRKCIQLKQRTSEVEEANDAARLRLARLKRQVEKMRLERAFLLEQLAKRTSTNVEDSDGSPSPPPTPKEKPLRIKRGHRKPSAFSNLDAPSSHNAATPGSTFISQNLPVHSPSSDAFSAAGKTNGVLGDKSGAPKKPGSAFDLYCDETRPSLKNKDGGGDSGGGGDVEEELARRWKDLPASQRDEYQSRADRQMAEYEKQKEAHEKSTKESDDNTKRSTSATVADIAATPKADDESKKRNDKDGSDKKNNGTDKAESTDSEQPAAPAAEASSSSPPPPPASGQTEEAVTEAAEDDESAPRQQEDVEMANYDTDDRETRGEKKPDE